MIRKMLPPRRTAGAPALAAVALAAALAAGLGGSTASADGDNPPPPPGSSPVCAFYDGNGPTLYGEQGERVSQVQCMLANRHYLPWSAVDGTFGPQTLLAVQRFQADNPPLRPNGLVTAATWSALWHAGPSRETPLPYPPT
ncbi:peptidoglycan-binding protein [Streptomyces sp. NBC_01618]|uniref:peptidoglycan-binding domain-containing protein n=1 Tax=Streptomyces sp. NBC_01618 TaxID=2975900 RepID=UPI0038670C7B|nr:peptidoglycan-binding protein [Streptomyces sp. NBC_01618]